MKTLKFNSEKEFNKIFNFDLQPRSVKSVNGIAVNVDTGSLYKNELEVSRKHVTISSYFVEKGIHGGYTNTIIRAPFIVEI